MAVPNSQLELAGILPLVASSARARVRAELTPSKSTPSFFSRRGKFVGSLCHNPPFDSRYVIEVVPRAVRAELTARSAPTECYVISNNDRYDGETMELDIALEEVGEGSLLLCIPGRLAYWESEDSSDCWIVERRS